MRASPLLLLLVLAACDQSSKPPPPPPEPPPVTASSLASALHVDAAAVLETTLDPPAPVGDLRADIDGFTTLDECVAKRAGLDPLVGDALHAIGYETFLRDACRSLDAAKTRDARKCEPIDASPLRARCEMLVAVLVTDADQCPWDVPTRPSYGRDPTCLAVASRDARLCAAADPVERPSCEALAMRDAKRCDAVVSEAGRALCRRELERWRTVLPEAEGPRPAIAAPAGKLVIRPLGGEGGESDGGAAETTVDLEPQLARGLVLVEQRDGTHFDLGTIRETSPSIYANPPLAHPHVGLSLIVASSPSKEVKIDHCELGMPNEATLVGPGARCSLRVTTEKLEHTRGGEARLKIEGEIGAAPKGYAVTIDVTTYVRDVVTSSALAATLAHPR